MSFLDKIGELAKSLSKETDPMIKRSVARPNVVGFYNPTGGAGTSAIVAHVAEQLHATGDPVVILDLDYLAQTQAKYFLSKDGIPYNKSIRSRILNPSISVSELVCYKGDNPKNVAIVGMSGREHPSDYALTPEEFYKNLIDGLSTMFTYVLVDITGSVNSVEVIESLISCDKVYSVVRPISRDVERLLYVKQLLGNLEHDRGSSDKIISVIQNQIIENDFSVNEFKGLDLVLKGNIFQDIDLMKAFDSCRLISNINTKKVKYFFDVIKSISGEIRTDISKYTVH